MLDGGERVVEGSELYIGIGLGKGGYDLEGDRLMMNGNGFEGDVLKLMGRVR